MRPIKFRAWDRKRKEMFPVHKLEWHKISGSLTECVGYDDHDNDGWTMHGGGIMTYANDERYVLMQFTGRQDKNGKDIYEGDQLFAPGNLSDELEYVGDVEWDDADARWEVANYHGRFEYIPNGCVVQGNIHELLEGSKPE